MSDNSEALRLAQELQRTEATGIPLTVRGREVINELVAALAQQAATPAPAEPSIAMRPMQADDGRQGWYIDHPAFYCDIEPDEETGALTVFFRDKTTAKEAFAAAPPATPAAQPADEREAFEAWLGRDAFTERSDTGKYVSAHVDAMWSAWQARAALEGDGWIAATHWRPLPAAPSEGSQG